MTGVAQVNRDTAEAITSRLPLVLTVIAVITFVVMFRLTGRVVLPLKTLLLSALSLTAASGALVGFSRTATSADWVPPPPARWCSPCRWCCSASRLGCRWTTRSSLCRASMSTG